MADHDPRSLRWQAGFEWLYSLMLNTLFFLVAAALVIPLPAAVTGLFAGLSGAIRPVPAEPFHRFKTALLTTFGRSWLLLVADLVVGAFLWFDIRLFLSMGTVLGMVAGYGFGLLAVLAGMVNVYAWPLLAWYPRPLGRLLRQAFLLAVAHPIQALGGLVGPATAILLFLALPTGLNLLLVMVGPALAAFLMGKAAWAVLQRYPLPDHELTFPSDQRP